MLCCVLISCQIDAPAQSNFNMTELREQSLNSVPCNPNTFWGIFPSTNPGNFTIGEYTINNLTIVPTGQQVLNVPNVSLGYSSNGSSNSSSTFFNVDFDGTWDILKLTNNSWAHIANNTLFNIRNCAGHDSIIVFDAINNTTYPKDILIYTSNILTPIFNTGPNLSKVVEDLAVDINNHIWFFSSYDTSYFQITYLNEIDVSGQLIKQYPFPNNVLYDCINAYGMFILNNILYLGIGSINPIYPNKLLPFSIINDTLVMGIPINCTANFGDLESCNQGTLTSISEVPESLKELSVYPNPAQDQFMLHLPYRTSANAIIQIYNLQGELVKNFKASDTSPINCSSWPRGIYFVSLVEEGKARVTRKVVVI